MKAEKDMMWQWRAQCPWPAGRLCLGLALVLSVFVLRAPELAAAQPVRTCEPWEGQAIVRQPASLGAAWEWTRVAKTATAAVVSISSATTKRSLLEEPLLPSVVEPFSHSVLRRAVSNRHRQGRLGSGVMVSPEGYVLTTHHVVEDATDIRVTLVDRRAFRARLVGTDPMTDLAVLKLPGSGFLALPLGDSARVEVAEPVLAIGNPFGLGQTVTMGIVSAVGRANLGLADYEDFIQTDAAINPGNSGGALLNICGELIGIPTALFASSGGSMGINFAVPVNLARTVLDQIRTYGRVSRGWLGIVVQELTPALARGLGLPAIGGLLVTDVVQENPAARAGFRQGDVIVQFGNTRVENSRQFGNLVTQVAPGSQVGLTVHRAGQETTLEVTITERPVFARQAEAAELELDQLGMVCIDLTLALANRFGLPPTVQGVAVIDVLPGSVAEEAACSPAMWCGKSIVNPSMLRRMSSAQSRMPMVSPLSCSSTEGERTCISSSSPRGRGNM